LEECKLRGTKVRFSAGHNYILLTSRSYRSTNSDISQEDGMEVGVLVRQCKEIFDILIFIFTFYRSRLGYINHKDIEIVTMLNISNTKIAHHTH
jgi:hypothetical protein